LTSALLIGQEIKRGDPALTDRKVFELVGKDFGAVFARFGTPDDLAAISGPSGTQEVVVDYTTFGFNVQNKKVRICQFWLGWPGTVDGIKLGTPIDDLVKQLGKPLYVEKDASGAERQFWELKDVKLLIYFDVDKNRKASRAVVKPYDQPKS
jgi:hypothetical protein